MNLQPIANQVLVQPASEIPWTEGGLLLPQVVLEKPNHGWVIAVGPRVWDIKIGDDVYYDHYAVIEITVEGHPFVMLPERDAIAKVA